MREMSYDDLITLCVDAQVVPPPEVQSRDDLLGWLLKEYGVV